MLLPFWAEDVVSGLWPEDSARSADATPSRSFVLLTTAANPSVAPMHDRMPFIVRDDQFDCWLNNSDPQLPSSIHHLLDKYPLDFYPVSREVNNVRNEHPDLIRPALVERELF